MTGAVTKAVLPVAGLATRFLPATKAMPKVMLPVMDKPLVQYAVEEALASGIEELVFVTAGNRAIEHHFRRDPALEQALNERGRSAELATVIATNLDPSRVSYLRQDEPRGLGHAVWSAHAMVGDAPFAVILADDLILSDRPALSQLIAVHGRTGGNVVAVEDVDATETDRYGILDVAAEDGRLAEARSVVEKPAPADAPSTLAVVGRYVLDPAVLAELETGRVGHGGEIQLTDAISASASQVPLHGWRVEGSRYDCGTKSGFLEATIATALAHPELAEAAAHILRRFAGDRSDPGDSGH